MEQDNNKTSPAPKKAAPAKLPGKPISFSGQSAIKNGKKVNASVNKSRQGSHLLRKLTGK